MSNATTAPPPASVWEDFVDIWYAPSQVFRRRENGGWGLALVVLAVLMTVIGIVSAKSMGPLIQQMVAHSLDANTNLTPEQRQQAVAMGSKFQSAFSYGAIVLVPLTICVVGIVMWIVGKFFGAKEDAGAAIMIATYAWFPRLLGGIVALILVTVLDTANMKGMGDATLSLARFLDPNTVSAGVYGLATRVDLFVIWETVLLGIGMHVVGRISKGKAAAVAVLMLLLGSIFQIVGAISS